ncbi:MAG: NAD(+) diphosphatase [Spirochaetaceae bacterium]|nr:NAD(+) diphosphatase [Spirochaetaceae bacterium]
MRHSHRFAGNPLDRGEQERRDEAWIEAVARDDASRFLPFRELEVLVADHSSSEVRRAHPQPRLGWLRTDQLRSVAPDARPMLLGMLEGVAHFAVDLSDCDTAVAWAEGQDPPWRFEDCRAAGTVLAAAETGILAQARSQLDWHARHGFCSVCGRPTDSKRGGQVRECTACGAQHFPRTDPVVITVVGDADTDRCLLGQSRGRLSRLRMYSALAGFVDQGEAIEEAVAREVMEEAGIRVKNVRYHSSQPWPFPCSLMIGCLAEAASTTIRKDDEEMSDVRWFDRREVLLALEEQSERLTVPGPIAIAHHLIKAWATQEGL